MKRHYKPDILKQLCDMIATATAHGSDVDYIEMTALEARSATLSAGLMWDGKRSFCLFGYPVKVVG